MIPDAASMEGQARQPALGAFFDVSFGTAITLVCQGYQFGQSNHGVYLLDGLRRAWPELLRNDWFVNETLQYHSIFGWLSGVLFRLGMIEPVFLGAYVLLAVLLHVTWRSIGLQVSGSRRAYVLSVLLFHLAAGGMTPGLYQFLQNSALLPSNVSNVALLGGLALWMRGRYVAAGVACGIAGLFHLNFALIGSLLWAALAAWDWMRRERTASRPIITESSFWIGTALLAIPSVVNVAMALRATLGRSGALSLTEFVELYVRFRHPHHYDPLSWPAALWVTFLWPLGLLPAWLRLRRDPLNAPQRVAIRLIVVVGFLLVVSFLGAGVWFVSETLVQLSLWRFAIYMKLLTCIFAAALLVAAVPKHVITIAPLLVVAAAIVLLMVRPGLGQAMFIQAPGLWGLAALCAVFSMYSLVSSRSSIDTMAAIMCIAIAVGMWGKVRGLTAPPAPDAALMAVCAWVRDPANTPVDAVFLVPPDDELFRLHAQRAIVVNAKAVPQLSAELPEWRDRLCEVLDLAPANLLAMPGTFFDRIVQIRSRYDALPANHLLNVARRRGARFLLVSHLLSGLPDAAIAYRNADYVLYDLLQPQITKEANRAG